MAIDIKAARDRVMSRRSDEIKVAGDRKNLIYSRSSEIKREVNIYFGPIIPAGNPNPVVEINDEGLLLSYEGREVKITVNDDGTFNVLDKESQVYGRESGTFKEKLSDEEISDEIFDFVFPLK